MCPNIRNTQVAKSVGEDSFRAVTEKRKEMKNEIQIGLEIQNSNLSALVYTAAMVYTVVYTAAAMVYTVVYTAAAMVYTVVYTAAAAGIYRGIYCGIYWYIGIYRSYIPVFTRAAIIPAFH